ncbi:hypothetical protein HU200_028561 [Digitaria exilis]|uniref:Uncharacterized protein n=1 Tax=Digitaria exilis TaxID=1010633 RepID=A0A835BVG4_9POAL|nr:hypothetical protein HU200_028561 [Digitaria exilis]
MARALRRLLLQLPVLHLSPPIPQRRRVPWLLPRLPPLLRLRRRRWVPSRQPVHRRHRSSPEPLQHPIRRQGRQGARVARHRRRPESTGLERRQDDGGEEGCCLPGRLHRRQFRPRALCQGRALFLRDILVDT